MKKFLGLTILLLTVASIAWGASSRENRADSTFYVGISPFGLHIPTLFTRPMGGAFIINENILVGGEFGRYTFELTDTQSDGSGKFTAQYLNMGAYARWFPGSNSFNVLLGMHQRNWDGDLRATVKNAISTDPDINVYYKLRAKATVGTIGLGNQWMADWGLVWGFDWLVGSGLISSSSTGEVVASALIDGTPHTLTGQEIIDAEKKLEEGGDLLNEISALPGFFIFSIGFAF